MLLNPSTKYLNLFSAKINLSDPHEVNLFFVNLNIMQDIDNKNKKITIDEVKSKNNSNTTINNKTIPSVNITSIELKTVVKLFDSSSILCSKLDECLNV